ncbi:TIGR00341 family protein, partial [Coleofasciculus sp. FACHB-712]|nr:TIGR00341 family protein [Coleofasciculus sp. FACHB-712]
MRQLLVQVPRGYGKTVLDIAQTCDGANLSLFEATGADESLDVVIVHVPNGKVEELLEQLQSVPKLNVTLLPRGVIALQPPPFKAAQQVTDVQARSPIEIFLSGLQSVGSWKGFLG